VRVAAAIFAAAENGRTRNLACRLVQKVRDDLSGMSQVEMEPKITGRNITMTLAPSAGEPPKEAIHWSTRRR